MMRAGFVSLVGRPNAGKSTLLNRLVGAKLSIVSPRPQTTRNRITGIRTMPEAQIVFVDTPGLGPGPGPLGTFMQTTAVRALEGVDAVCAVVDATTPGSPGPEILEVLRSAPGPAFCVLNKIDEVRPRTRLLPLIEAWRAVHPFREILPLSARVGTNCDRLLDLLVATMPEHPPYFPADAATDQPETFYISEVIREKIFALAHEEVPYAAAVRVDETIERTDPASLLVRASVFVERPSQRGILVGRAGVMLKRIGTAARLDLEAFFGVRVHLILTVAVRRNWRKDARALREFGFRLTS